MNNLVGNVYGRLVVLSLEKYDKLKGKYYYRCRCECGKEKVVDSNSLVSGSTRSCGCYQREKARENIAKSKVEGSDLYGLRRKVQKNNKSGIKGVCYDKSKKKYAAYIGFKGTQYKLGHFDNLEDAKKVRLEAEERLYKPFLYKYKRGIENGL